VAVSRQDPSTQEGNKPVGTLNIVGAEVYTVNIPSGNHFFQMESHNHQKRPTPGLLLQTSYFNISNDGSIDHAGTVF
jgi:hypothetical protein